MCINIPVQSLHEERRLDSLVESLQGISALSPSESGEIVGYVLLDAGGDIGAVVGFLEFFAGDVLVELDVAVGDAVDNLVGHLGHLLAFLALEAVVHEPFADKLLAELTLVLAFLQTFLVALGIEVAAAVGSVDLVDEVDLAVALAAHTWCQPG